jgi:ESS family glutamate:Na+ symporter
MGETLPAFMVFGAMSLMLLIGVLLRAKVGFIQKAMIPASLLGGALGFVLVNLGWLKYPGLDGAWTAVKAEDLIPWAFHAFNISFISLCLTRAERNAPKRSVLKGGLWLSMIWSLSLTVQALVGAGTVVAYNAVTGSDTNIFLGYLVTHGFTQGPGQGLAMGGVWSKAFQVPDGPTMGLIWATMGFVAAYVAGVPYARYFVKKGMNVNKRSKIDEEFLSGILKDDTHLEAGRETTHSASTETLAYHLAIIGLVYIITYFELNLVSQYMKHPLFSYPMFFFHGLVWATILRIIMDKIGVGKLLDPGMQKRITGMSVDYLLVSSVMGISLVVLTKYLGVIIVVSIAVTIVTFLMVEFFRRRLSELGPERAVSTFGCCCGSAASGLLLLRILDADYSTSVGVELAFFNVAILFTTLPILMVMAPGLPGFGQGTIIGAYLLYSVVCVGILWFLGSWRKAAA